MKKFATLLFLAISTSFFAQNQTIWLNMQQLMNKDAFALFTTTDLTATKTHQFARVQYYLSGISIIHDGGQEAPFTDLYLLVNAATDSVFNLGQSPYKNIEGIKFSVGVDQAHNHLDPTTYPPGHPLAPQIPEMQWGWASGYRFIAIEGDADGAAGPLADHYEVHALGDANYFSQTILTSGKVESDGIHLRIKADYNRLLDGIDTEGGFVAHTTTGKAVTVLKNAQTVVFSAADVLGICCDATPGHFNMAPNPANGSATIAYDFSPKTASPVEMRVFDASCRPVLTQVLENASGEFRFNTNWAPGMYLVEFSDRAGHLLRTEKLMVR